MHTHSFFNVGEWSQRDIDRLVLPTAATIELDEVNELQEEVDEVDVEDE